MTWLYIITAICALLFAGTFFVIHEIRRNRKLSLELQAALQENYRINASKKKAPQPSQSDSNVSLQELVNAHWEKAFRNNMKEEN